MADINEIFRIMHTIKGSAAMMLYDDVSKTAHSVEDLFFYLREENPTNVDYSSLTDLVLEGMDYIKVELDKIKNGNEPDADPTEIINKIKAYLKKLKQDNGAAGAAPEEKPKEIKQPIVEKAKEENKAEKEVVKESSNDGLNKYSAKIYFEDGCEMENVRAFTLLNNLKNYITEVSSEPEDIIAESSAEIIKKNGFSFDFKSTESYDKLYELINGTIYLKKMELRSIELKTYKAEIYFEDGCEMENVRAFTIVHNLESYASDISYEPADVIDEASTEIIRKNGFKIKFSIGMPYEEVNQMLMQTVFLKQLILEEVENAAPKQEAEKIEVKTESKPEVKAEVKTESKPEVKPETPKEQPKQEKKAEEPKPESKPAAKQKENPTQQKKNQAVQQMISVNIGKLDQLLNLMGELVISEAMTVQNPDLEGLELENFSKSARQLRKIINDVQDTVMSMRMVSLSTTFFKMHRIVRDMCKQLGKNVELVIVGEETEVDKNIIEHISDPLMHIIRNSVDHGIEMPDERRKKGKDEKGTVLLEAKNSGGEVLIIVKDDGQGIDKEKVLNKARSNGLLKKPEEEYTDREIYQFIFHPGFSTNDKVTAYSGRGVGMDVVTTNVEEVGGSVVVESAPDEGTTTILKIPLTLAIIEGMLIKMGGAKYTLPIASIQETFKAKSQNVFIDPDGNEMITLRDEVYNVVRLYDFFNAKTDIVDIEDGVLIMLENEGRSICLFADELVGEQQVVVKSIPKYINKPKGISGCTLLGNGDISLIIDVAGFFDK